MTSPPRQRSLATSPDDDNPWLRFHRLPVNRVNTTNITSAYANNSACAEDDAGVIIEKHSAEDDFTWHDDNESANISDRRVLYCHNANCMTDNMGTTETYETAVRQEFGKADDTFSEFVGQDNKAEVLKFIKERSTGMKEHTSAKCTSVLAKTFSSMCTADSCSEIEFALECKIEDCDCAVNWQHHRETLYDYSMSPSPITLTAGVDVDNSDCDDPRQDTGDICLFSDSRDYGSRIRNMPTSLEVCEESQQPNEWSPFMLSSSPREDPQRDTGGDLREIARVADGMADLQRQAGVSAPCASNDQSTREGFEIVEWSFNEDNEYQTQVVEKGLNRRHDSLHTTSPQTTPSLDLSGLDGYHTAPNSPASYIEEYCIVEDTQANATNHAVPYSFEDVDVDGAVEVAGYITNYTKTSPGPIETAQNDGTEDLDQSDSDSEGRCRRCHKYLPQTEAEHSDASQSDDQTDNIDYNEPIAADANTPPTSYEQATNNRDVQQTLVDLPRPTTYDNRILKLENPPLMSTTSLHYEGDPVTGGAQVVGRGSFGIIYKARFTDHAFYNLPICVKEFDEEFSDTKDIFEEAQRLYYLQDTGYVPICYGILCYGDDNDRHKYAIVQELVGTGLTLEQMLWDQYELPIEFWFGIASQCCEGLARFHSKGILLNDIKTNNILLEFGQHSLRIRYIDFGLATDMAGKKYKNTKSLEDFVYLAPEVRVNGGVTNIASDIFSLGFMLEQIRKYSGVHELSVVASLCMDFDPAMRLPVRGAISLITDQAENVRLMHNQ